VEQALTPQDAIAATESIYRELAEGKALNRARSQVYLPAESREHPGFQYRMKTQKAAVSLRRVGAARHVGYGGVFRTQRCQSAVESFRSLRVKNIAVW